MTGHLASARGLRRPDVAQRRSPIGPGAALSAAAVGVVCGLTLATQYVAARLAFHPHLGRAMYLVPADALPLLRAVGAGSVIGAAIAVLVPRGRWAAVPLLTVAALALGARHGVIYSPARLLLWYRAYHRLPGYQTVFAEAWLIAGVATTALTTSLRRLPHAWARVRVPTDASRLPPGRHGGPHRIRLFV